MRLPLSHAASLLLFGTSFVSGIWLDDQHRNTQQTLLPDSFSNLVESCANVAAPSSTGPYMHVVTNGANLENQMDEFFAYYKYILGAKSISFYHHLPMEEGDPSKARDIAKLWGVRYDTYDGTDLKECENSMETRKIPNYQCTVLRRGIAHLKDTVKDPAWNWVLYVDIDEFVDLPNNRTATDFLRAIGYHQKAVRFPQYLFGTEHVAKQEGLVTANHMYPVDVRGWDARSLSAKIGARWPANAPFGKQNNHSSNVYQKAAYRLDATAVCQNWVHYCTYDENNAPYYPDPKDGRLHHYMIVDEEKLGKSFWHSKHGISEGEFRQLLNSDILNEKIKKQDLTKDEDWTDKVRTLSQLVECKDRILLKTKSE